MGWGLELGTDDTTNASLLKQLTKAVTKLLSGSDNGAGELLSIVGVNPSVILGTQMKAPSQLLPAVITRAALWAKVRVR